MSSGDSIKISPLFDFEDHDIVIRSRDKVDFKVHKLILKHASEVWSTMFSLPEGSSKGTRAGDVQVMELDETADVIDALLRFIYPVSKPMMDSFDKCLAALVAATKYEISVAVQLLSQALVNNGIIENCSLRAYAVAALYGLEDVKKQAYQRLLTFNFLNETPATEAQELASLSALDYHILWHKKMARSKAAITIVWYQELRLKDCVPFCSKCGCKCWYDNYLLLVADRLVNNATSSALYFRDDPFAVLTTSKCSVPPGFIKDFSKFQNSSHLKEIAQKIDNLP